MFFVIALALILFSASPWWFASRDRARLSAMAMAAAMIPIGFSMMDGVARMAPTFRSRTRPDFIQQQIAPNDKVIYEGPMHVGSSPALLSRPQILSRESERQLRAGLETARGSRCFPRRTGSGAGLEQPRPDLSLVERERVQHWQAFLQSTTGPIEELVTCGTTVLLSNRR
jgi:hypothetical protein